MPGEWDDRVHAQLCHALEKGLEQDAERIPPAIELEALNQLGAGSLIGQCRSYAVQPAQG
jgi:hypothetical protein